MSASLKPGKGCSNLEMAMSGEALIQIVCENDKTRVFFSQKFTFRKIFRKSRKIKDILRFIFCLVWKMIG